jgi:tetratricopeptide (TPR) repeat protein
LTALSTLVLLVWGFGPVGPAHAGSDGITIQGMRIGIHPSKTRLVLDISGKPTEAFRNGRTTRQLSAGRGNVLLVALGNVAWRDGLARKRRGRGNILGYWLERDPEGRGVLVLASTRPLALDQAFFLPARGGRPGRWVFDVTALPAPVQRQSWNATPPGAEAADLARFETAAGEAVAQADPDSVRTTLSGIFSEILSDPGNPELNLRYARLAEEAGEVDRALAAYRRILASHPDNPEAKAGLAKLTGAKGEAEDEAKTVASFVLTGQYETNAARRDPSFLAFDSALTSLAITATDERTLGGTRIRTQGKLYADAHSRYEAGDLVYGGLDAGPVIDIEGFSARPALGLVHTRLDKRPLFNAASLLLNLENKAETETLRSIDLSLGYRDFADRFLGRDGLQLDGKALFSWSDMAASGDRLSLTPSYAYSHTLGKAEANRHHALGAHIELPPPPVRRGPGRRRSGPHPPLFSRP